MSCDASWTSRRWNWRRRRNESNHHLLDILFILLYITTMYIISPLISLHALFHIMKTNLIRDYPLTPVHVLRQRPVELHPVWRTCQRRRFLDGPFGQQAAPCQYCCCQKEEVWIRKYEAASSPCCLVCCASWKETEKWVGHAYFNIWIFVSNQNLPSGNAAEASASSSNSAIPSDFFDAPKAPAPVARKQSSQNKESPQQGKNSQPVASRSANGWYFSFVILMAWLIELVTPLMSF